MSHLCLLRVNTDAGAVGTLPGDIVPRRDNDVKKKGRPFSDEPAPLPREMSLTGDQAPPRMAQRVSRAGPSPTSDPPHSRGVK
jgi:hypothetical protein